VSVRKHPKRHLAVVPLVALGLLGLLLKAEAVHSNRSPARESDLDRIVADLESSGLVSHGRSRITRDGSYVGTIVSRQGCDGLLAIVPLYRNAEGSALASLNDDADERAAYVMNGRIYSEFPDTRLWVGRGVDLVKAAFGVDEPRRWTTRILALRERGRCDLMAQVAPITAPDWDRKTHSTAAIRSK
jgi:hypothetical protein